MSAHLRFALGFALLASACGGAPEQEAPAPAISTEAADNLIPGQLARGAALQTEIRSAGWLRVQLACRVHPSGRDGRFWADGRKQTGDRREGDGAAGYQGVRDADLSALSTGRDAGTPDGGRKPKYFSDVCRGQ